MNIEGKKDLIEVFKIYQGKTSRLVYTG